MLRQLSYSLTLIFGFSLLIIPQASHASRRFERAPRLSVVEVADEEGRVSLELVRRKAVNRKKLRKNAWIEVRRSTFLGEDAELLEFTSSEVLPKVNQVELADLTSATYGFEARTVAPKKNGELRYSPWSEKLYLTVTSPQEEHPEVSLAPVELPEGVTECPEGVAEDSLYYVNLVREGLGLQPLLSDPFLDRAAKIHGADDAYKEEMSHDGWFDLIFHSGFDGVSYGQNLAFYIQDPATLVDAWMGSPGHAANIVKPTYTHLGVSCLVSPGGVYYWVHMFGAAAP